MIERLRFWSGVGLHFLGLALLDPSIATGWIKGRIESARFRAGAWLYRLGRALVCVAMTTNGNGLSYAQARQTWRDMVERARRHRREDADAGA